MIKENLQEVERRICEACKRSGRDRSEVQLIAVSKTKPVSMIEEAYAGRNSQIWRKQAAGAA